MTIPPCERCISLYGAENASPGVVKVTSVLDQERERFLCAEHASQVYSYYVAYIGGQYVAGVYAASETHARELITNKLKADKHMRELLFQWQASGAKIVKE